MLLHLLSITPTRTHTTTSLPFFRLIYIAVTPSIDSPAIDKFIFSHAAFLLSAINLTLLISPFYSSLLLHHPSCVPPSIGSVCGVFKQLTSIFSPPSIGALLLLSIERSSYFFVSAVQEDTTASEAQHHTFKSGLDLNTAVWQSFMIHITVTALIHFKWCFNII